MIKFITRCLLLAQLLVAGAIALVLIRTGIVTGGFSATVLAVAIVLLVRAGITANNFLIAHHYSDTANRRSPLGIPGWWRVYCEEFFATMVSSSWTMPFQTFDLRLAPQPRGLPVLLIHGYGCNSGYWHAMSAALLNHGISHRAVDLEPIFAGIDEYVHAIDRAVHALLQDSGAEQLIILAHSMGGLAARAYLRDFGAAHVARLITLGTPHHGTGLANFGIGTNCQQMRWQRQEVTKVTETTDPTDSWLASLNEAESAALRARLVSIYSLHDNIISPRSSCCLDGARNIAVTAVGHVALALSPVVQARVIDEIEQASGHYQSAAA